MTKRRRTIPRYDLVTPMIPCKDEILAGIDGLLSSGRFVLGEEVAALEREIAEACDVAECVGVASGSDALLFALQLAGVVPGAEVVTPAYSFVATVEAILRLGATPVFVDIDPVDLNLDTTKLEAALTARTRAILPVHIFGAPCRMDAIAAVAEPRGIPVIEDLCQSFGSFYGGRPCGSFGRMSSLSFYPTKNLPGIGDGGMILCRSAADAADLRELRGHGVVYQGKRMLPGWNSRLDELQALTIRIRLSRFADEQADRDRTAALYDALIPESLRLPAPAAGSGIRVTHHQYWIRVPNRDTLTARLDEAGVEYGVYYDPPLDRHALAVHCRISGDLAETRRAGSEVLALPIHQALADADARMIGELVRDFVAG